MEDPQAAEAMPTALVAPWLEPASPAPEVRPPRVWTVFVAFAGALVGQLAAGIGVVFAAGVVLALRTRGIPGPRELRAVLTSPEVMLGVVALSTVACAATALLAAALSPEPMRARLAATRAGLHPIALAVAVVGGLALSNALAAGSALLRVPHGQSVEFLDRLLQGAIGARLSLTVLCIGLLGPGCEELLFRGYIQSRLCRRWGPAWGIVVTAALFGLVHFDRLQSPLTFVLGLYLGWLAHRSGSILPAFLVHAANNTLWTLHGSQGVEPGHGLLLALLPVFLAGAAASIAWLRPRFPAAEPATDAAAPAASAAGAVETSPAVDEG